MPNLRNADKKKKQTNVSAGMPEGFDPSADMTSRMQATEDLPLAEPSEQKEQVQGKSQEEKFVPDATVMEKLNAIPDEVLDSFKKSFVNLRGWIGRDPNHPEYLIKDNKVLKAIAYGEFTPPIRDGFTVDRRDSSLCKSVYRFTIYRKQDGTWYHDYEKVPVKYKIKLDEQGNPIKDEKGNNKVEIVYPELAEGEIVGFRYAGKDVVISDKDLLDNLRLSHNLGETFRVPGTDKLLLVSSLNIDPHVLIVRDRDRVKKFLSDYPTVYTFSKGENGESVKNEITLTSSDINELTYGKEVWAKDNADKNHCLQFNAETNRVEAVTSIVTLKKQEAEKRAMARAASKSQSQSQSQSKSQDQSKGVSMH